MATDNNAVDDKSDVEVAKRRSKHYEGNNSLSNKDLLGELLFSCNSNGNLLDDIDKLKEGWRSFV